MTDQNVLRDALVEYSDRRVGEQEVLAALRSATPASGRRARTGWVAAGVLTVTGAFVAGLTLLGGGSAAYAVTENPDGTVTVSIKDIAAIDPANEQLRELGVRITAVPMTSDCTEKWEDRVYRGTDYTTKGYPRASGDSVTFSRRIPEGHSVLVSVSKYPNRGTGLGYTAPVRNPAPSCVLDPADDPEYRSPRTNP
ncbi:hypothetical protein ACFFQW_41325 [Umezawaea endophytica]|uniref:Uncharacterized protein n=1 Tax=Umezawaea endophytica TaxID=1654476 RepID=A0A9X3AEX2_9PSEU|nr:hypothetical protein [Umezawaea endophytica]MCS7477917.1 hypothetical protein [Umezawaea endophytica]